jgi:prepilin-type N-terminal cleavage/methylation domain-containing protein
MSSRRSGFTLIELLVVIAIIAILSVVVVLTLNPAEMLRESRDNNRLSDMDTLTHALSLYQTDAATTRNNISFGAPDTVYVSVPDPALRGSATSTCGSLNLPVLPSGFGYECVSS